MRKYTYRTQQEIDADLTATGNPTVYTVIIAGVTRPMGRNFTLTGAIVEVNTYKNALHVSGIVVDTRTNEIAYSAQAVA